MKSITIEELERIDGKACCIVDIRPKEQYDRGSFPGAVNIPMEQLEERKAEFPTNKAIFLLCHTGERSRDYVDFLEEAGYDAVNIDGGYRAYLKLLLSRYMKEESDEKLREKTAEIEKSIIKKFRKSIWSPFTKALHEYQLIQEGDRVAVCISGGKDSMLLAKYIMQDGKLILGPFQGKVACTQIAVGKGVCGTAVATGETQRVDDVYLFAGHIACDSASNSELVISVYKDGEMFGVLDIDSPIKGRFSEEDQAGLEALVKELEKVL